MHPYIGLHGRVSLPPRTGPKAGCNDYTGTVVEVAQGGSIHEESVAYCAVILLRDEPSEAGRVHETPDIEIFIPDDLAEARRRLEGAK